MKVGEWGGGRQRRGGGAVAAVVWKLRGWKDGGECEVNKATAVEEGPQKMMRLPNHLRALQLPFVPAQLHSWQTFSVRTLFPHLPDNKGVSFSVSFSTLISLSVAPSFASFQLKPVELRLMCQFGCLSSQALNNRCVFEAPLKKSYLSYLRWLQCSPACTSRWWWRRRRWRCPPRNLGPGFLRTRSVSGEKKRDGRMSGKFVWYSVYLAPC